MSDRSLTLLVHGLSKSGKSSLSVTSPAPRLYMDVESASRFLNITRVYWDPRASAPPVYDGTWDTCVVPTRDWDTVQAAYAWLASGQHPFKSFIIDSVSELQVRFIENVAGRTQPTQQGWGDVFRGIGGLCRDIRDLTMHPTKPLETIVLTAMTKNVNGIWRPYLQGQLADVIPYLFDVVGYLYVENVLVNDVTMETAEMRRLLTRRTPTYEAGERVQGRIPVVVDNPNVEGMVNAIFGTLPVEASPGVTNQGVVQ